MSLPYSSYVYAEGGGRAFFKTLESTYQKMWHYILEDMILFTSVVELA
jgi:hypothetical protein